MPMKSQAQRAFMHIHHPGIAKRWEKETPKGEKLPKHVGESDNREVPSMSNVFESKGKKRKPGGPGEPTTVDPVPQYVDNPLDDLETEHDRECMDSDFRMGGPDGSFPYGINEDLDTKKLRSTDDFVKELEQFANQMSAETRALQSFIGTKKGDPKLHQGMRSHLLKINTIVSGIGHDAEDLVDEVQQLTSYMETAGGSERPAPAAGSVQKVFRKV